MHEFTIMDSVIRSILGKGSRVKEVTVEMGELLGLSDESIQLAFETLSKGTPLEGSRLVVRWARGRVACPKCGYEGEMRRVSEHMIDPAFPCPSCGAPLEVQGGNGWRVLRVG